MKKVKLIITLLVIVTGMYSQSISDNKPKQDSVKFYVGKDTLNGVLVSFSGFISSDDVLSWMKKNKIRPATLKELQFFGIENEISFGSGIVALGSEIMSGGFKIVSVTINDKRGITKEFYPLEGKWNGSFYKFLAVCI